MFHKKFRKCISHKISAWFLNFIRINPIYFSYVFIVLETYFGDYCFSLATLGVYYLAFVRADFIKRLLLLLLTLAWELLLGLFCIFGIFRAFFPGYILFIDRLFFSFFSLFDFPSAFLLSGLLAFLGSIDLWGDLLLDLLSLGSFLALLAFVGDFWSLEFAGRLTFEFPGLRDLLRAIFWSDFLFYRTPLFILI